MLLTFSLIAGKLIDNYPLLGKKGNWTSMEDSDADAGNHQNNPYGHSLLCNLPAGYVLLSFLTASDWAERLFSSRLRC